MHNKIETNKNGFALDCSFEKDVKALCEKHFVANTTDACALLMLLADFDNDSISALYKIASKMSETEICESVRDEPVSDVVHLKHGIWFHLGGDEWGCSNCGHCIATEGSWEHPWQKFCENCGTCMDEVNKNDG